MTKKFYLHNGTNQEGPFSKDELLSKGVKIDTMIWYEGIEDWKKLEDIDELKSILDNQFKYNNHTRKSSLNYAYLIFGAIGMLAVIFYISKYAFSNNYQQNNDNYQGYSNSSNSYQQQTQQTTYNKIKINLKGLRLRNAPQQNAEVLYNFDEGEEANYLNEQTNYTEKIEIRGITFNEPWYKVQELRTNKIGWIYGGGLKQQAAIASSQALVFENNNYSEHEKYEKDLSSILDAERRNPLKFLQINGEYRKAVFGGDYKVSGTIYNYAQSAEYKDIVIEVSCYSKTGTLLGTKQLILYEIIKARKSLEFSKKLDTPSGCNSIGLEIVNAEAYFIED